MIDITKYNNIATCDLNKSMNYFEISFLGVLNESEKCSYIVYNYFPCLVLERTNFLQLLLKSLVKYC